MYVIYANPDFFLPIANILFNSFHLFFINEGIVYY